VIFDLHGYHAKKARALKCLTFQGFFVDQSVVDVDKDDHDATCC
jgi:hypothetical protein